MASEAEGDSVTALPMGRIASFYYLKYTTMAFLRQHLGPGMDLKVPMIRLCVVSITRQSPLMMRMEGVGAGELMTTVSQTKRAWL